MVNQLKVSNLEPEIKHIYQREVKAYEVADVVLTITADDKEKMLMTLDQEFDLLLRLARNETVIPSLMPFHRSYSSRLSINPKLH